MKFKERPSKSMSTEISSASEMEHMGLQLRGRDLIPLSKCSTHNGIWFALSFMQLLLLSGGIAAMWITGYSLAINPAIMVISILFLTIFWTWFFMEDRKKKFYVYSAFIGILVYAFLLLLTQKWFLQGAMQTGNAIMRSMNYRYDSSLQLLTIGEDVLAGTMFLIEVFVLITFLLAWTTLHNANVYAMMFLLFPIISFFALTGLEPSTLAMFSVLFGILGVIASSKLVRKKRLWGEKQTKRFQKNLIWHKNIQKKTAVLVCGIACILSIPSFYILRPGLDIQLKKAEMTTAKIEGGFIEALIGILPKVSAGKLNLKVETSGGGVADGALGDSEGFALENVEDLSLTVSFKPEETIYLRGYTGSGYTGNHWLIPEKDTFQSASMNWMIDRGEDREIYIQNLSFLRKLYIENQNGQSQMQEIKVERLNANKNYTYYPYHAFLNDYYEVEGGDCYVSGQETQDDIFSFFPRKEYEQAIKEWNLNEEEKSVLDRIEASYGAFVKSIYTEIPTGFEELKEQIAQQEIKKEDIKEIETYIYSFLQKYEYTMDVEGLEDGEDFIQKFLYETKSGYSTHFASSAVLMFRMFGIPARYVTGYAAPQNVFTAQTDGTYSAILQADNAHSWVEIYVEAEGWKPVEMTPGALGTLAEVEYVGDETEHAITDDTDKEESEHERAELPVKEKKEMVIDLSVDDNLESVIQSFALLLFLGIFVYVIARSIYNRRRDLGLGSKYTSSQKVGNIFMALYHKMEKKGMPDYIESTTLEFYRWLAEMTPSISGKEYNNMMKIVLESAYGFCEPSEEAITYMRSMLKKAEKDLKRYKRNGR